jgi:hypothetical protein
MFWLCCDFVVVEVCQIVEESILYNWLYLTFNNSGNSYEMMLSVKTFRAIKG